MLYVVSCWLYVVGCQLSVICCMWLYVVCCRLYVVCCMLSVVCCPLSIVCQLSTVHLLSTVRRLSVVCHGRKSELAKHTRVTYFYISGCLFIFFFFFFFSRPYSAHWHGKTCFSARRSTPWREGRRLDHYRREGDNVCGCRRSLVDLRVSQTLPRGSLLLRLSLLDL